MSGLKVTLLLTVTVVAVSCGQSTSPETHLDAPFLIPALEHPKALDSDFVAVGSWGPWEDGMDAGNSNRIPPLNAVTLTCTRASMTCQEVVEKWFVPVGSPVAARTGYARSELSFEIQEWANGRLEAVAKEKIRALHRLSIRESPFVAQRSYSLAAPYEAGRAEAEDPMEQSFWWLR
jgi:hypothetical protein